MAKAPLLSQGAHSKKLVKKEIYSSILDRLQNDEVYVDERMVRIFGLHQNNRYFAQSLSRTIGTI